MNRLIKEQTRTDSIVGVGKNGQPVAIAICELTKGESADNSVEYAQATMRGLNRATKTTHTSFSLRGINAAQISTGRNLAYLSQARNSQSQRLISAVQTLPTFQL